MMMLCPAVFQCTIPANKFKYLIQMAKTAIKIVGLWVWTLLIVFSVHRGAIRPELRYSRVAEGNIAQSVHAVWSQGWSGYVGSLKGDAWWGRVRPLHLPFHSVPYLLTLLRNGDLFHHDAKVPISDRINGDLQTHGLYLLGCFSLALSVLALAVWRSTGNWWVGFLLPLLCVPGNRYLSQNLLVNFCDSGEIGQLLFISMYIWLLASIFSREVPGRIREALAILFLLMAYGMKETTVVLLPVALMLLGWLSMSAPRRFRIFAVRHSLCHVLFCTILLWFVYSFKSGAYVSQNYMNETWSANILRSWEFMTIYSPAVPYVLVGGLLLIALLLKSHCKEREMLDRRKAPLFMILLACGLCAGFWVVNIPWGQPMDKYYLPVHTFACMAGVLILHVSVDILWRQRLWWAAILWAVGSLTFLFHNLGDRITSTRGYYIHNYNHRAAIPIVVEDIAQTVAEGGSNYSAHIVATHLFQEGPLPFLRWLNRFEGLNISENGHVVSQVSGIEHNYFRRYEGVLAVELTLSDSVPEDFVGHTVYFLIKPDGMKLSQLEALGYEAAELRAEETSGMGIWKFTRSN